MPRQRNSSKKKEQAKVTVTTRDIIKTDISNIPDPEIKAMILRILTGLEKNKEDFRETPAAEIKEL